MYITVLHNPAQQLQGQDEEMYTHWGAGREENRLEKDISGRGLVFLKVKNKRRRNKGARKGL